MKNGIKLIIIISIIAIIGFGIGGGLWYLGIFSGQSPGEPPEEPPEESPDVSNWITPGVITISQKQWIKIGMMGDIGELQGDANYQGGYLAAKEINEAGGVVINGSSYYVAIAKEDTDECNSNLNTSIAVDAAEKMIYENKAQFAVGGYRKEALIAYREPFMSNEIIFISTGDSTDKLCEDVVDYYGRYKYFFRMSPVNSSSLSNTFGGSIIGYMDHLRSVYGVDKVNEIGLLVEDLPWTESMRYEIPNLFNNTYGGYFGIVPSGAVIAFDIDVNSSTMNAHLQQLEDAGCDIVLIGISGEEGILITQLWKTAQRPFMLIGSNIHGFNSSYWEDTNGTCEYEIGSAAAVLCNKTTYTYEFYENYLDLWNDDPIYIAFGAYDAVNAIVDCINATQSFKVNDIITEWESWTTANPHPGAGGGGAWNPNNHDLIAGYPWGYPLWYQWQRGTKTLLPSYVYYYPNNGTIEPMGSLLLPPWIETVWTYVEPIPTWITPGVTGIPENQWIKIGLMGDRGKLEGDQNYMGGYLAAKKINEEGGVDVNGTNYYVAIATEDTDEQAANLTTSRAVDASEKMIYENGAQFAIGGFNTNALLAYREPFMTNKIPFLGTGAMIDIFCTDVVDNYARYKYFWRVSPYNSTYSSFTFVRNTLEMYYLLNATYGSDDIDHMGILAEDLPWTEGIRTSLVALINAPAGPPYYGIGPGTIPTNGVIAFDPDVNSSAMDAHLQQLEDAGCDVVLIAISETGGIVMSQQWRAAERPFLLFGSNVQAQTAGYWDNTNGTCEYEVGSTTATRCNKTPYTIEVYDMFINEFNEHPIYIGFGAYDAVNLIVDSINKTKSFNPDTFIADMETYTPSNPKHGGAGGDPTCWTAAHDLYAGYPFAYGVRFQWQSGIKTLIPSVTNPPEYPSTLSPMGTMQIPPWFGWDEG